MFIQMIFVIISLCVDDLIFKNIIYNDGQGLKGGCDGNDTTTEGITIKKIKSQNTNIRLFHCFLLV